MPYNICFPSLSRSTCQGWWTWPGIIAYLIQINSFTPSHDHNKPLKTRHLPIYILFRRIISGANWPLSLSSRLRPDIRRSGIYKIFPRLSGHIAHRAGMGARIHVARTAISQTHFWLVFFFLFRTVRAIIAIVCGRDAFQQMAIHTSCVHTSPQTMREPLIYPGLAIAIPIAMDYCHNCHNFSILHHDRSDFGLRVICQRIYRVYFIKTKWQWQWHGNPYRAGFTLLMAQLTISCICLKKNTFSIFSKSRWLAIPRS